MVGMITADELRRILHYDHETGLFTRNGRRIGYVQPFSSKRGSGGGYRRISISRSARHYEHRLAWLYMTGEWPAGDVDHINRDPADNRWANLRLATRAQNRANSKIYCRNSSGYRGVRPQKPSGKWEARISNQHLGTFATPTDASAAYEAAARERFGAEFIGQLHRD